MSSVFSLYQILSLKSFSAEQIYVVGVQILRFCTTPMGFFAEELSNLNILLLSSDEQVAVEWLALRADWQI